jgi:hypothetical protein
MSQRYYYIPCDTLVPAGPGSELNRLVVIDELGATALPQLVLATLDLPTDPNGCPL